MIEAARSCSNPDCDFDQGSDCAEGDNPDTCTFRSKRPLILDDPDEGAETDDEEIEALQARLVALRDEDEDDYRGNLVSLGLGERLSEQECTSILSEAPTRIISFIAPKDAGKTSLIAGLYEIFLEGRRVGAQFRASRTILGFERLCHLSRAVSGRSRPDMERTRHAEGLGYFHLDLVGHNGRVGLLLGDRPGENFVTAAAHLDQMRTLEEVGAATTLAYLIDGRVLANVKTNGVPRSVAVNILDAMVEAGLPRSRPALAVVLTKADLLEGERELDTLARFDAIVEHLRRRYATSFGSVTGYRTAASPEQPTEKYPRGEGLSRLLEGLLSDDRDIYRKVYEARPPSRCFEALGSHLANIYE